MGAALGKGISNGTRVEQGQTIGYVGASGMVTGAHLHYEFRVNGVVRNMDAWYDAFNVTPEDDLYLPPEERVRIW